MIRETIMSGLEGGCAEKDPPRRTPRRAADPTHRARDTVWHEDDHQAWTGNGPRAAATLRNLALGLFAIHGITKIKQTVQAIGRDPLRALPLIT